MGVLVIDEAKILPESGGRNGHTFYAWLSHQFNGSIIVDVGTLGGKSALSFASNSKNLVITYDTDFERSERHGVARLSGVPNVITKLLDINEVDPSWFSKVDIIFLDISHTGNDEEKFLNRIAPYFKGILIMDDIDCPKRWPGLNRLFNSLDRKKYILSRELGACRGTGVLPYGDWTIKIEEVL